MYKIKTLNKISKRVSESLERIMKFLTTVKILTVSS